MKHVECVIIGGGPAGLKAAAILCEAKVHVTIIDRNPQLGGQLIKQTHKFFGSQAQHAKMRGYDIADLLIKQLENNPYCTLLTNTTVVGLYPNNIVTTYNQDHYREIKASKIILATGASEKSLAFENNDLPGIMGAGAIQTLMNVHGIKVGDDVIMIGSGNIGLIVSYQLLQAGINVKAIVEATPHVGGYGVHANKVIRHNIDILTQKTIKRAIGTTQLEAVELVDLDTGFNEIPNSSTIVPCDVCCVAVGLSPAYQLAAMMDVTTTYIGALGGNIVVVNDRYQSSNPDLYVVGDALAIEEASCAMMEGALSGLYVAQALKQVHPHHDELVTMYQSQLAQLRDGPYGQITLKGLKEMEAYHETSTHPTK